jgi:hypothetical protein
VASKVNEMIKLNIIENEDFVIFVVVVVMNV